MKGMDKKNFLIAVGASVLIGLLAIPTAQNLPLPSFLLEYGKGVVAVGLALLSIIGYVFSEILAKLVSAFREIGRFAVVGVLNTVLDFAVLNTLIIITGVAEGILATAFAGISFIVAVTNSYYWNKYWTFELKEKVEREFFQFFVISIVGFGLNVGAFHIVVNVVGPVGDVARAAWANLGKLAGTLAGLTWNFLGYKFIVFKKQKLDSSIAR